VFFEKCIFIGNICRNKVNLAPLSAYCCSAKYSILVKIWLCFGTQLCGPRGWGNRGQHSRTVQSRTFEVFEVTLFLRSMNDFALKCEWDLCKRCDCIATLALPLLLFRLTA